MTTATMTAPRTDWTKEEIAHNIATDLRWLYRGILAIYARQTRDEQASEATRHHNSVGFNGRDAGFMSSIAKQIEARRYLTTKQLAASRKVMAKYAGQLAKIANGKIA